jgi:inorganic phosphate transporter, PiT family
MIGEQTLLIIALITGFYAAWNIGANDVANAMGTSVGSRALTLRQAVICAAIFEFLGAVLFGSNVSETLQSGIINTEMFTNRPMVFVLGMLSSLLATGLWLQFASYCGLPVSTTHSIVGAIVGFGSIVGGIHAVLWDNVFTIAFSWIASPLLGACISYFIFMFIRQHIFYQPSPLNATKKLLPIIAGVVIFVLSLSMTYHVLLPHATGALRIMFSLCAAVAIGGVAHYFAKKVHLPENHTNKSTVDAQLVADLDRMAKQLQKMQNALDGEKRFRLQDITQDITSFSYSLQKSNHLDKRNPDFYWTERIFGYLQISSACLMAFAHGSNDVSNAIGPMAAIISTLQHHISGSAHFPTWALVLGGVGIVTGLATWGWRVIETIGKRITELTPSRGFSAEFGASLTILLASRLGFPISTTHTLVGAVFGVGFAGGLSSLNVKIIRDILVSWFVTIPAGALLSIICYYILASIMCI